LSANEKVFPDGIFMSSDLKGDEMVVKQSRARASIQDSLARLTEFFSSDAAEMTDERTLATMQHDLIVIEARLKLFTEYDHK
jgi:hypothetical protein